jgi:hypothetical protein
MRSKYIIGFYKLLAISLVFLTSCKNNGNINTTSRDNKEIKFADEPGEYVLKDDLDEIKIPFEMFAGNKPMISGKVKDKEVRFLIDNGKLFNEIWFYNGEVDSIGLHFQSQDADSLIGIGENSASLIFEGNPINVDFENIKFNNQPTLISPPEAGYASFFPGINGQVSSMFFKHFIVKFDFKKNIISLIKPENFRKSENQVVVNMQKRDNGSYCIPFELHMNTGEVCEVLLDIDIGTVFPLYLISSNKNSIPISPNAKKQFLGLGASGELYGYNDTLKELRFSDYVLEKYPTMIVKEEYNADATIVESGTFGIELMKQFDITFDYFNEKIYFEPNEDFKGGNIK